jgi:integrase
MSRGSHHLKHVAECLYRDETSDVYYAIFWLHGRQIKKSLKTTERNIAVARRDLKRRELGLDRAQATIARDATFQTVATAWLDELAPRLKDSTRIRREHCIRYIAAHFDGPILTMTRDRVTRWAKERSARVAARTFNMELRTIQHACRYAMQGGIFNSSPAEHIRTIKPDAKPATALTRDEFGRLMQELKDSTKAAQAADLIAFLAFSGCRLNEALAVTWGDVDTTAGTLTITGGVRGTKNRRQRIIPLFAPLRRLLASWTTGLPHVPLFTIANSKTALRGATSRAGLPHVNHHTFRHCFATWALQNGVDVPTVAYWLGHQDGGVLVMKTYSHVLAAHSRAMAEKVDWDLPATAAPSK